MNDPRTILQTGLWHQERTTLDSEAQVARNRLVLALKVWYCGVSLVPLLVYMLQLIEASLYQHVDI